MDIQEFGSFDEMVSWLTDRNAAATAALHPIQQRITFGSDVICLAGEVLIFGHIYTKDELMDAEREAGASNEEIAEMMRDTVADDAAGRCFGMWYSTVEPRGQLGSNHKFNLWPLEPRLLAAVAAAGWSGAELKPDDQMDLLTGSIEPLVAHLMEVGPL